VPFMPLRGLIGSDILKHRHDWQVIDNPFSAQDPIVLLPAIKPDFALFHALLGDRHGNVWIGRRRELMTMAHAAAASLVTVERIYDGDLLADETMAAGCLPGLYVQSLAHVPRGAWPLGFADEYALDADEVRRYLQRARSPDGFRSYIADWDRPGSHDVVAAE